MKKKYDFIIYTSLSLAIICLSLGLFDYYNDTSHAGKQVDSIDLEADFLLKLDKNDIINKYLVDINNRIVNNDVLTAEIMNTWKSYKILLVEYNREVTDNYYAYKVDLEIEITDKTDLSLMNYKLNGNNYNISFIAYIDYIDGSGIVKTIDFS